MKRKISTFLFGLLFLIGFGILIYPTVSNQWNTYRQNQLISSYDNTIQDMEPEDFTSEWEKAKAFNDTIQQNNLYGDVFGEDENDIKDTEYWKILNVADDGVMGYLSIPKINIKLAIYHGTDDKDLQFCVIINLMCCHIDNQASTVSDVIRRDQVEYHR